jgi:hypothetical protein
MNYFRISISGINVENAKKLVLRKVREREFAVLHNGAVPEICVPNPQSDDMRTFTSV